MNNIHVTIFSALLIYYMKKLITVKNVEQWEHGRSPFNRIVGIEITWYPKHFYCGLFRRFTLVPRTSHARCSHSNLPHLASTLWQGNVGLPRLQQVTRILTNNKANVYKKNKIWLNSCPASIAESRWDPPYSRVEMGWTVMVGRILKTLNNVVKKKKNHLNYVSIKFQKIYLLLTTLCTWHNHWENSKWDPACTGFALFDTNR